MLRFPWWRRCVQFHLNVVVCRDCVWMPMEIENRNESIQTHSNIIYLELRLSAVLSDSIKYTHTHTSYFYTPSHHTFLVVATIFSFFFTVLGGELHDFFRSCHRYAVLFSVFQAHQIQFSFLFRHRSWTKNTRYIVKRIRKAPVWLVYYIELITKNLLRIHAHSTRAVHV